jgi:hypothetical protein
MLWHFNTGLAPRTLEQRQERGRAGGLKTKQLQLGIFAPEYDRSKGGRTAVHHRWHKGKRRQSATCLLCQKFGPSRG